MLTTEGTVSPTFATTQMGDGYEIEEVDEFFAQTLDILRHREEEIRELRSQLTAGVEDPQIRPADESDVTTAEGTGTRAAVLLEIAARAADELVDEAKAEAATIMAKAHADADQLSTDSRAETERVHAELDQTRTDQIAELERHRTAVLSEVEERQAAHEAEVARLQQLEQDYRDRMRGFLTEQLARIEPTPAA